MEAGSVEVELHDHAVQVADNLRLEHLYVEPGSVEVELHDHAVQVADNLRLEHLAPRLVGLQVVGDQGGRGHGRGLLVQVVVREVQRRGHLPREVLVVAAAAVVEERRHLAQRPLGGHAQGEDPLDDLARLAGEPVRGPQGEHADGAGGEKDQRDERGEQLSADPHGAASAGLAGACIAPVQSGTMSCATTVGTSQPPAPPGAGASVGEAANPGSRARRISITSADAGREPSHPATSAWTSFDAMNPTNRVA
ncbi:MAG: hypothetical protein FJ221_17315, partial [Lentisphaerae bacterium]|nr:hypothetical protein [Lentisphaerota bacterium]